MVSNFGYRPYVASKLTIKCHTNNNNGNDVAVAITLDLLSCGTHD